MIYATGQTVTVNGRIMTIEDEYTDEGGTIFWLTDEDGHSTWYPECEVD